MSKLANVGQLDRLLRIVVGAILIAAPYFYASPIWENPMAKWGAMAVGAIAILTAVFRFCPAYKIFGIKTCKLD